MKYQYPILILVLILLVYSCIAGCTSNRGNYGISPKPALPYITPGVSPPPASPPVIPSSVTSFGTRKRTSFGHVIALPAAQGLTAEVPAGCRPAVVDSTTPLPAPAAARLLLA